MPSIAVTCTLRIQNGELQPRSSERALLEVGAAGLASRSSFDAVTLFDFVAREVTDLDSESHAYAEIL